LSAEVLERFRPRPVAPEVSRRIQSFMDVRAPGLGMLTPDGKTMFFSWAITGVPQIWKLSGPKRFPEQVTGGEDVTALAEITPDGSQLIVQRDRKGEENPGLYLQSTAGGPLVPVQHLEGVRTMFEHLSEDGRTLYFTSNERNRASYVVYSYDLASKSRNVVFDQVEGLWHVSDSKRDGKLLLRKETGALSAEYYEYEPKSAQLTPLFGQNEQEEYFARYGTKEGELIVLTNKPGEYRALYKWSGGQLTPLSAPTNFDVESFEVDQPRRTILYSVNERGYRRLLALDARSGRPLALPKLPEADNVSHGAVTPDGRFVTLSVDDGRRPPQGYVLDWRTLTLAQWHAPSTPEIDTSSFARAELTAYPARDGAQVPAFVRRPKSCAAEPCPVVVVFHGGPEAQSRPGFNVAMQLLVDVGFVVVEPNVRGSDGYGKSYLRADDGPKRLAVITDIEDAAKWARAQFAVNGQAPKVGIYGGSYGGYSVLMAMTMFAGAYDAGVDIVGISDLRTFLKNTAPYRRILRITEYGDPERDAEALAKLSPLTYVDRVRAPLLIEQGASDPRVPAGEALQVYEALRARGVECQLSIYADEGHGAQKRENRVLMLGHAIEFLKRHLSASVGK
jgi:dipeptidyl aminopeptidase/acylaminoacyl peptidase